MQKPHFLSIIVLILLAACSSNTSKKVASKKAFLKSENYHQLRKGLKNSQVKFERLKKGRVVFLGGSITYNPGWRDSVCQYLTRRFPETEFEFIAAGIPSMGTTPAAFRLERDVLSAGKIDLLFEEAAVNDATNGRTQLEQIRAMEGIVRHLRQVNPAMDIILMHFVDPDKMKTYNAGKIPAVITNHEQVAKYYQLPSINLAKEVTERIANEEFSWEKDFIDLHPSPFGQGIYAHSIITLLEKAFSAKINSKHKIKNNPLPKKLDAFSYDHGHLVDIGQAKVLNGWSIHPKWKPNDATGTRKNYTNVPMLVSTQIGSTVQLDFKGKAIGIAIAAGQDAGMIEYKIDDGTWQKLNLYTRWSSQLHLPWYYTLAAELENTKHQLTLKIAEKKDEQSNGYACRIRYFYVNEN